MGDEGDLAATRLGKGSRCFAAWFGKEVAGYAWLSGDTEWIGEIEMEITPGPGEAYIWNCFTLESHRRKGVFRALLAAILDQGQVEGKSRLWIGSLPIPAEKAIPSSGFVPALRLNGTVKSGMIWVTVRAADDADSTLVESARGVMAIAGQPLRLGHSLRRSRPRRH